MCRHGPARLLYPLGISTIGDEAAFREIFDCPDDAVSGIDFTAQRLHISQVNQGSGGPSRRSGAHLVDGVLHLSFSPGHYCSASFPPNGLFLTLIPKGHEEVVDDVCTRLCAWVPAP